MSAAITERLYRASQPANSSVQDMLRSQEPLGRAPRADAPVAAAPGAIDGAPEIPDAGPGALPTFRPIAQATAPPGSVASFASLGSAASDGASDVASSKRFKHYQHPTVADSPVLMQVCEQCIAASDHEGLAAIARNKGLPPNLRGLAWPLLLRQHPYVLQPNLVADFPTSAVPVERVPLKRIAGELRRLLRRVAAGQAASQAGTASGSPTSTLPAPALAAPALAAPSPVPASAPAAPLSINTAMPTAVPAPAVKTPSMSSSGFSASVASSPGSAVSASTASLGTGGVGAGGAAGAFANAFAGTNGFASGGSSALASPSLTANSTPSAASPVPAISQLVQDSISQAVVAFLEKWGDRVSYEPAMVWVAYYLSVAMGGEPVDAEVFEHAMLVFCHAPEDVSSAGRYAGASQPRGPADSSLAWSVSLFISWFRSLLPELAAHFDQEHLMSFLESEEWLVWWIKWYGVKALRVGDAARLWDVYFAWRRPAEPLGADTEAPAVPGITSDPAPPVRHMFACLSVLKAHQFKLAELDQSEIRQLLSRMPAMDMELVNDEAIQMYERHRQRVARIYAGLDVDDEVPARPATASSGGSQ